MTKKLCLLAVFLFATVCFAQNPQRSGYVVAPQNGYLQYIANAPVTLCEYNTQNQCNTTVGIYSDPALTVPIAYPYYANAMGYFSYYAPAGTYVEQQCMPGGGCLYFQVTLGGGGSGAGSVTSVSGLSPLFSTTNPTTTPTFSLSVAAQNAAWLGPVSGGAGTPSYRAIAPADLPLATSSTFGIVKPDGTTCSVSAGVLSCGGTGTVTSVGLSVPAWLTVSGSPVTSSGTLAVSATAGQTANQFLATPNGATGAVGLRAIVAADLPLATTGAFGAVKPDGSTITISAGVISASGASSSWSALTNPSANLALTMGANRSTFTYNAATGASDLFALTDTASNTGTGILFHPHTASGSTEIPFQADANGLGWKIAADGSLQGVGSSTPGIKMPAGTALAGAAGSVVYSTDATNGYAEVNENNTGLSRICTVLNALCGGGGSSAFAALMSGTNTTAAMLVGTGSTFGPTGTGTVTANALTNNVLINTPSTAALFVMADSIGQVANGNFPGKVATLIGTPSGSQHLVAVGGSSLADMLSCNNVSCVGDGTFPLTFPLGVAANSKALLEPAYNDLSNMGVTPTGTQLSYYFGGLKAWALEFGIPDSQKIAANNTTYCTTTGTWTSAISVPGAGTFPTGTLKSIVPGSTITCTGLNATDAGFIGLKTTGSTTATFTVNVTNAGVTANVSDPYTSSTTLNQTAPYTSQWGAISNFYAIGQPGLSGGYTSITLTASNNSSDPVYVIAPYFISPSSGLQNAPAVEVMLESRAGCNGACSTVSGALHNDSNTNIMRTAQMAVVDELRPNGLNVSYFDPNATPSGFNSSDNTQTTDGTHPNGTSAQYIANTAFVNLNSAAATQDHFLPTTPAAFRSLTTIGTSGAASLINGTLNIPNYSGGGGSGGYVNITSLITPTGCTIASGVCTTTGTVTSITFSSIPAGYTSLRIVGGLTSAAAATMNCQMNGDTGSNYAIQGYRQQSGTAAPLNLVSQTAAQCGLTGPVAGNFTLDFPFYASTTIAKSWTYTGAAISSASDATNNYYDTVSGAWNNTAAVTSIKLISGQNITIGSSFVIYAGN